jgi:hypothetical protein
MSHCVLGTTRLEKQIGGFDRIMPAAGHEQAGLGRRVEWLPGMDRSTNFLERIGPFPRGIPSETSKIGQSLKRISRRGSPVWGAGFAPFAPHIAVFLPLGVALIRLGVGSNPESRSVWSRARSAEGNVSAACSTTIIGTLLEHPFEFLDTTGLHHRYTRPDTRRSGNCPELSSSERGKPAGAPSVSPRVICPVVSRPSCR